jgi:outer membrane protein assembly factor BamB
MLKTKMTNPVVVDGHAIALSDGFVSCVQLLDEKPGLKKKWNKRSRYGNGQILAVGDKLLIHGEDGILVLAKINFDKFEKLGQIKTINGFCWNTIAIYGDLVLVRSEQQAACYRLPVKDGPIIEKQNAALADPKVAIQ